METAPQFKSELKKILAGMSVDEALEFPIEDFAVVRVYANEVANKCGMEFRTHCDRQSKTIEVTRLA